MSRGRRRCPASAPPSTRGEPHRCRPLVIDTEAAANTPGSSAAAASTSHTTRSFPHTNRPNRQPTKPTQPTQPTQPTPQKNSDEGADILIVARTDARQAESLDEALARAAAFAEAGADVLFIDALGSEAEMKAFCDLGGAAAGKPKVGWWWLFRGGETMALWQCCLRAACWCWWVFRGRCGVLRV